MDGFDFAIDNLGDMLVNQSTYDTKSLEEDELRIQLAYTRIKSISHGWFYDYIGANLEELIGKPIQSSITDSGVKKIKEVLTFDNLWTNEDIYIQTTIKDSTHVIYSVYLKTYTDNEFEEKATILTINLDLVKGVNIHFGN